MLAADNSSNALPRLALCLQGKVIEDVVQVVGAKRAQRREKLGTVEPAILCQRAKQCRKPVALTVHVTFQANCPEREPPRCATVSTRRGLALRRRDAQEKPRLLRVYVRALFPTDPLAAADASNLQERVESPP